MTPYSVKQLAYTKDSKDLHIEKWTDHRLLLRTEMRVSTSALQRKSKASVEVKDVYLLCHSRE